MDEVDQDRQEDIFSRMEDYAANILKENKLYGWSFAWDRAKRRLGSCRYKEKIITLSAQFVSVNSDAEEEIIDTILHEVAHALAWENHRERAHGPQWKKYCMQLGATPRARAGIGQVRLSVYTYAVRLKTSGEIVAGYYRRPALAKHIRTAYIKGCPQTRGQLELIRWEEGMKLTKLPSHPHSEKS